MTRLSAAYLGLASFMRALHVEPSKARRLPLEAMLAEVSTRAACLAGLTPCHRGDAPRAQWSMLLCLHSQIVGAASTTADCCNLLNCNSSPAGTRMLASTTALLGMLEGASLLFLTASIRQLARSRGATVCTDSQHHEWAVTCLCAVCNQTLYGCGSRQLSAQEPPLLEGSITLCQHRLILSRLLTRLLTTLK